MVKGRIDVTKQNDEKMVENNGRYDNKKTEALRVAEYLPIQKIYPHVVKSDHVKKSSETST